MPNLFQRLGASVKAAASAFVMHWSRSTSWYWGRSGVPSRYSQAVGDGRGNSIVMACAGWLMRTFPEAPFRIRRYTSAGELEPVRQHDLIRLLRKPNPYYSGLLLWGATVVDRMLTGNAYWLKVRSRAGLVVQLWWVPSTMIEPAWPESGDGTVFIESYTYTVDGRKYTIAPSEVVHFRYGIDPLNLRKGLSPLAALIREIFMDSEIGTFMAALLANIGIPGVVISPGGDESIDQPEADMIKANWQQKFGSDRRGEPLVLGGKTNVTVLGFSPEQMDLSNLSRLPEERVTAVLGLPAVTVGLGAGLDRAIYNNASEAREAAYESHVIPAQRELAEDIRNQLLVDFEDNLDEWEVDFDLSEVRVLQQDQDKLWARLDGALKSGALTLNQSLTERGMETVDGGDVLYIPINVTPTPIDQLASLGTPPPVPAAPPPSTGAAGTPPKALDLTTLWADVESKAASSYVPAIHRLRDRLQAPFARQVASYLTGQQARVTAALSALLSKGYDSVETKDYGEEVLDWNEEQRALEAIFQTAYRQALNGTHNVAQDALGTSFEIDDPLTRAYLQQAGKNIVGITETTQRAISHTLQEGQAAGEGVDELLQRIQRLGAFSEARARTIARTELGVATVNSSMLSFEASGVVVGVEIIDPDGSDGNFTGCVDRNGKRLTLEQAKGLSLLHPNCRMCPSPLTRASQLESASANGNGHVEAKDLVTA